MRKSIIISIRYITNYFLEILFPSKCIGCRVSGRMLCESCIKKLRKVDRETENNIMAIYDYRDPIVKKVIWNLKYYHSQKIGQELGRLLYYEMLEEIANIQIFSQGSPIYIVPVPISIDRKRSRGYNQSEIIAKSFCSSVKENILQLKNNIVTKKANTIPQAKITNRTKRLKNIKGAFEIKNPELVKGKTIIIIDDVTTTGATITEIIKILKKSGAKKVLGFAVAH